MLRQFLGDERRPPDPVPRPGLPPRPGPAAARLGRDRRRRLAARLRARQRDGGRRLHHQQLRAAHPSPRRSCTRATRPGCGWAPRAACGRTAARAAGNGLDVVTLAASSPTAWGEVNYRARGAAVFNPRRRHPARCRRWTRPAGSGSRSPPSAWPRGTTCPSACAPGAWSSSAPAT